MMEYMIAALINCAEPRLSFREFAGKNTSMPFRGYQGELISSYHERMGEAAGNYAVYSVRYAQQCPVVQR